METKKVDLKDKLTQWLLILAITAFIGTIGNLVGYSVPIMESLPGILIIFALALVSLLLQELLPFRVSYLIYITMIGMFLASPICPLAEIINPYVAKINQLALSTVCLAFAGVGMAKDWKAFKNIGIRGIIAACCVIIGTFLGSAIIANIVLSIQGLI